MGIRFFCPNGHKVHVKTFQAGHRGFCPECSTAIQIPTVEEAKAQGQFRAKAAPVPSGAPAGDADDESGPIAAVAVETASGPPSPHVTPAPKATNGHAAAATADKPAAGGDPVAGPAARAASPAPTPAKTPPAAEEPTLPDPIAENPSLQWYIRPPAGGQYGPARGDLLREWIAQGRVAAQAYVWREDWPDWKHARDVLPQVRARMAGPTAAGGKAVPTPPAPVAPPTPASPKTPTTGTGAGKGPQITGLTSAAAGGVRPTGPTAGAAPTDPAVKDINLAVRSMRNRQGGYGLQVAVMIGLIAVAIVLVIVLAVVLAGRGGEADPATGGAASATAQRAPARTP